MMVVLWDDAKVDKMVLSWVDSLVGLWGDALVLLLSRSDKDKASILL